MLYQIFFLPQVKRSVITNNKKGIYKFPHDLRLKILENQERSGKSVDFIEL